MKTMRPDLNAKRSQPSLLDIKLGSILEIEEAGDFLYRYILVGMSLTGYALISLHDDIQVCSFLEKHAHITSYPLTITSNNISINTYADCSKVITCHFGLIGNLIKEKKGYSIGQLENEQAEAIITLIKDVPTIALNIKNEYFI
jgi:hypothetical protein